MEMKDKETVKSFLSRNALWRLQKCLAGQFSFQHEEEKDIFQEQPVNKDSLYCLEWRNQEKVCG
jgi:hypothetical protein